MQCHAKSKRSQSQCRNPAMKGLKVSRIHGGKTPRGPASVHYKDGRRSRFLPSRMFQEYASALHDPELISMRRDIALMDARIIDVLQRVDTGEAGSLWRQAQAAFAKFRQEQDKNNVDGMTLALMQAERLITQWAADYAAWHEVGDLIEQRRKLCESEQRRVTMAHETLNQEQALALMGQVVAVVKRHVPDPQILTAIALEMQALGHQRNGHHVSDDAC
jgi:hypothetical protein